jgi:hypothetical protein
MLGEQVVEALLENGKLPGGFITFPANGHGRDFAQASIQEKVRGRVDCTIIMTIVPTEEADLLLNSLRKKFPTSHLTCWTETVHSYGDFG